MVVLNCFTQSEYGPYSDAASLHPNDRVSFVSALRKREDEDWNKLLGRALRFNDLDLLDAPLRLGCAVDEVLSASIRAGDRALARVAGAIAKMARGRGPEALAVLLPLALGGHIDHRIARAAGLQAFQEPFAASSFPVAFYEDLPYAARPELAGQAEPAAEVAGLSLAPVFACPPPAVAAAVASKRRMAQCYDSQIDSELTDAIASFCERYEGRERLWANAAWRASAALGAVAEK